MIDGGTGDMARSVDSRGPMPPVPLHPEGVKVESSKSLEMALLAELRAALAEHDIASDVREEVSGLAVTTDTPGVALWVFVSFGNRYFSWAEANHQHPVNDVPGAARRIAIHLRGFNVIGGES